MRIAVYHNLPSGGAKRALYGFVRHLADRGYTLDAFVPSTATEEYLPLKPYVRRLEAFSVRKTVYGRAASVLRRLGPPALSLADLDRVNAEIARRIDAGAYDLLLCEQDQFTLSPFLLRHTHTPTVYSCPQPLRYQEEILQRVLDERDPPGLGRKLKQIWRRRSARRLAAIDSANARHADYVVVNSRFTRESVLRTHGINSFVSYPGIDIDHFRPEAGDTESYVLSVGSCGPSKGFDFVIRALAEISPPIRPPLVLVSNFVEPKWPEHLQRLAAANGVDLTILRQVPDTQLRTLYARAAAFVYAPYLEPLGLTPLEAMACGTPVVAVAEGGVRETVRDGDTGILTDRHPAEFAEALMTLLSNPALRAELTANGRDSVLREWTFEKSGIRLEKHLRRATAGATPNLAPV